MRSKRQIVTSIIVAFVILAIGFIYISSINNIMNEEVYSHLREVGLQNSIGLRNQIENELEKLSLVTETIKKQYVAGEGDVIRSLSFASDNLPFLTVGLMLNKSQMAYTTDGDEINISEFDFYRQLAEGLTTNKHGTFSERMPHEDGKGYVYYCAVPFIVNLSTLGYAYGVIDDKTLVDILDTTVFDENGYSLVINTDADIVIDSGHPNNIFSSIAENKNPDDVYIKDSLKPLLEKYISEGKNEEFVLNGQKLIFMPLEINDWYVVTAVPEEIAYVRTLEILGISIAFLLLILLASLILTNTIFKIREKAQNKLLEIYSTDDMTRLYNDKGFEQNARTILDTHDETFFVIDFDVNWFESYNALNGVVNGDKLIKTIGTVLKEKLHYPNIAARIFADRFEALIMSANIDTVKQFLEDIDCDIKQTTGESSLLISYGIYQVAEMMTVREMVNCATVAKRIVKGNYDKFISIYDEELHLKQIQENEMVASMETAMRNNEFVSFYQPKYSISTEKIVGAEALVRWQHPSGEILPGRFIELFEKKGLIVKLDFFMLESVCKKLRRMLDEGMPIVPISVNFSRAHLYDDEFVEKLAEMVKSYNLPPALIEAEFTETAMTERNDLISSVVEKLHSLGFVVSMDDFGSGYSSLNVLKDMAIDVIKLDKVFMEYKTNRKKGKLIIRTVVNLAKKLSLITVAEGVETEEQLEFLKDLECDVAQGYYFSRPIPEEKFDALLMENLRGGAESES